MGTVTASNSLSVISTNASNNTAVVRYTVNCSTSGDSYNNNTQTGTFYIDGVQYSNSYKLPLNTNTTVFSKDVTINNASGRTINASYSFPTTPYYGTKTGNASTTIPVLVQAPVIQSLTLKSRTLTSLTFSYNLDANASTVYYKLSNQSSYTQIRTNTKSGDFTISNLSANTAYTVNFLARNTAGGVNKDSTKNVSGTTFDIARISSASNFNHGDSTTVGITNPSGVTTKLRLVVGGTTIFNRNVSTGNNSIGFSDAELDNIYKKYGSGSSVTATFIVDTYNGSNVGWTNSKDVTISLKGNQKTAKTNVNGAWKRSKVWVNVSGTWRRAVVWVNINGAWKRGI